MLPSEEIEDFALRVLNALLAKYDPSSKAKMRIRPLYALLAKYALMFYYSCVKDARKLQNFRAFFSYGLSLFGNGIGKFIE